MEITLAIKKMEDLESGMARMYEALAEHFKADSETSAFFESMKLDELAHLNLVQMQKRMVRTSPSAFYRDVDINEKEMKLILDEAALLKSSPTDLKNILERAYLMESSAAEIYAVTALRNTNKDLAKFLIQITNTFSLHFTDVESFAKRKGVDISRVQKQDIRQVRVPFTGKVLVNEKVMLKANDISEGGMFCISDYPFEKGSILLVAFMLMSQKVILNATVTFYEKEKGLGLKFLNIDAAASAVIRKYIEMALKSSVPEIEKDTGKRVILIHGFEDNDAMDIYVSEMTKQGFRVAELKSLPHAFKTLSDEIAPSHIIVSMASEKSIGFLLLPLIKKIDKIGKVPLLAVGSGVNVEFKKACLEAGADYFLERASTSPKDLAGFLLDSAGRR